ncbi:MAG: hypothetical protein AB8G14_13080 [Ilumatobacter sp.]
MSDINSPWPNGAAPAPNAPLEPAAPNSAGGSDGLSIGLSAVAIVGLLVAVFALWVSRCDVDAIDRLVASLPGAFLASGTFEGVS